MNNTLKIVLVGVAGVIIGFLATYFLGSKTVAPTGSATTYGGSLTVSGTDASANTNTLTIGDNGSAITELKATLCTSFTASTLATGDGIAQAASTTKAYDCAVTGVASGDVVLAQFGSSTPITTTAGSNYWAIISAKASSTAGYVSLLIYNNGPSAVPSALGVGSSTNIWYLDN